MAKQEKLIVEGKVIQIFPGLDFGVEIGASQKVLAHLSGKMQVNHLKVLLSDVVLVELSPYDLTRGRIVRRVS